MTGADAAVQCLEKEKTKYVFGYPGVAIAPFYNSILGSTIKTILCREEQNAAHEASGYARVSGRPGVAAVTSGPGAANIITGIATAFADSIPIIVITGQVDSHLIGSDVFQEADILGACESFVKFSYSIRNISDIPRIFHEAFYIASSGRKGPVLIDFPQDIQKEMLRSFSPQEEVKLRSYRPTVEGNAAQIRKVFHHLEKAKRPILCVGGGVHLAGAEEKVRAFADHHQIPVVSTMMGLGVMEQNDPMYFGMVGGNGRPYGNRAMNEADMIIMAGARVADRSISQPDLIMENKTLVHLDVDPAEIGKNVGSEIPLVGDIGSVFDCFNQQTLEADFSPWISTLNEYKAECEEKSEKELEAEVKKAELVTPLYFLKKLSAKMDDDAVYCADVGQNQLWSCHAYQQRRGRFLTSGGMGTMGYSIPAAIGAKLADPSRQCVAVTGDGAFQMSMMELATMRQYDIPVKIVVIRNNTLGLVRQHQRLVYKGRYSMTDLDGSPDLEKLSAAYDMPYYCLESNEAVDSNLDAFLGRKGSALLEVRVDADENA